MKIKHKDYFHFLLSYFNETESSWCWAECANIWLQIWPAVSDSSQLRLQAVVVVIRDRPAQRRCHLWQQMEILRWHRIHPPAQKVIKYHLYAFICLIQLSYCFSCFGNAIMLKQICTNTNKPQQQWNPGARTHTHTPEQRERDTHAHPSRERDRHTHSECSRLTQTHKQMERLKLHSLCPPKRNLNVEMNMVSVLSNKST